MTEEVFDSTATRLGPPPIVLQPPRSRDSSSRRVGSQSPVRLPPYLGPQPTIDDILADDGLSFSQKQLAARIDRAAERIRQWCKELENWKWTGTFAPPLEKETEEESEVVRNARGLDTTRRNGGHKWWGSLPAVVVEDYEDTLDRIQDELVGVDMDDLKERVLDITRNNSRPSSSSSTWTVSNVTYVDDHSYFVTRTLILTLPQLTVLNRHLKIWSVRLAVLRMVPTYLGSLGKCQREMNSIWNELEKEVDTDKDSITKEQERLDNVRELCQFHVFNTSRILDAMLDTLEGHDDILPDSWIDDFEVLETDLTNWSVAVQNKILELRITRRSSLVVEPELLKPTVSKEPTDKIEEAPSLLNGHVKDETPLAPQHVNRTQESQSTLEDSPNEINAHGVEIPTQLVKDINIAEQPQTLANDLPESIRHDETPKKESMNEASFQSTEPALLVAEPDADTSLMDTKVPHSVSETQDMVQLSSPHQPEVALAEEEADTEPTYLKEKVLSAQSQSQLLIDDLEDSPRPVELDVAEKSVAPKETLAKFKDEAYQVSSTAQQIKDEETSSSSFPQPEPEPFSQEQTPSSHGILESVETFSSPQSTVIQSPAPTFEQISDQKPLDIPDLKTAHIRSPAALPLVEAVRNDAASLTAPGSPIDSTIIHGSPSLPPEIPPDLALDEDLSILEQLSNIYEITDSDSDDDTSSIYSRDLEESPSHRKQPISRLPKPPLNSMMRKKRQDKPPLPTISTPRGAPETPRRKLQKLSIKDTKRSKDPDLLSPVSPVLPLEQQISNILDTIPTPIRLKTGPSANAPYIKSSRPLRSPTPNSLRRTISNQNALHNTPPGSSRPSLTTHTSGSSTPTLTLAPAEEPSYARSNKHHHTNNGSSSTMSSRRTHDPDVRIYHLIQTGRTHPIKLFIRRVGENGERVMVRVGGGWADLSEYLRIFAQHHGRRAVSEGAGTVEVLALSQNSGDGTSSRVTSGRSTPVPGEHTPNLRRSSTASNSAAAIGTPLVPTLSEIDDPDTPISVTSHPAGSRRPSIAQDPGSASSLAGPFARRTTDRISDEKQEWVDGIVEQAKRSLGEKAEMGDLGKRGGTRRVFFRKGTNPTSLASIGPNAGANGEKRD